MKALASYDPASNQEPRADLLRLLLTYALDMVDAMNNAEGLSRKSQQLTRISRGGACGKLLGSFGEAGNSSITRKDLMAPFKSSKKYAFYWKLRKEMQAAKRFSGTTQNKKNIGFDRAMKLDTVLENTAYNETSSFM